MDTVKSAARKVSEVVFPGMKLSYGHKFSIKSEEVLSSLPLQMCLYFNVNYSFLWILIRIGCLVYKFHDLSQLYQILLTTVIFVMVVVEISRLYLGYVGNLTEKVPELAGFWLLTLFLQFPLQCLCTFSTDFIILPWERLTDTVMMIFLLFEIFIGYFTVKTITNHQALKFKLQMMKYNATSASTETSVE
ncbi:transmembrane protein 17 [Trichonephila inaurata madagascariensis]|uniref:Transmembrane protein 17 n=1 Tax=Trichonephila inaurata madagascariensis TaxID=2747483 RepID=A0A8X6Y3Z6_9ARAC|nr:transmembrane protein 17 [Trichonephila inaurata madagascariensis]